MFRRSLAFSSTASKFRRLCPPPIRVNMSDSTADNIVYLEDLQAPSSSSPRVKESNEVATVVKKKGTVVTVSGKNQSTTSTSLKRQRTLADMFSGPSATKSAQPGAKKIKLDQAAGSPSSGLSGSKSLNSIPFSLSGYVSSLSDEEKQLLALECETIGKSWQVLSSLARLRTRVFEVLIATSG